MVKGIYYKIIRNMQFSGEPQVLQYIYALPIEPEFGLMENLIPQMMGKLSQTLKVFEWDPDTPTLTEVMIGTLKSKFVQAMTQYMNKL